MYYFDPHEIISSLVTPLMDASKRAREYIVEISLNDAPVRVVRRLSVPSNLYVGHFVYELVAMINERDPTAGCEPSAMHGVRKSVWELVTRVE